MHSRLSTRSISSLDHVVQLAAAVCLLVSLSTVNGFANPNGGGWNTRPAVPELAARQQETKQTPKMSSSPPEQSDRRQPWDVIRFVQQSSKFVSLPNPFSSKDDTKRIIQPGTVLWEPSCSEFSLAPLDDVVMGGVSSSTFDNDTGMWKGQVTDANNGGFVGIRSTPALNWNMENCNGIELKLRGGSDDKKKRRFKVVLRDSTDFNGICWSTSIDVDNGGSSFSMNPVLSLFSPPENDSDEKQDAGTTTTTVRIPFDKQIPTIFARTVPDQTFQKDNVVGVQLAYSKFEYDGELNPNFQLGDMSLQILEIRAY